jgi:hypothetical protein
MFSKLVRQRLLAATILTLCVSALLAAGTVNAQESRGWSFRISPYLWALSLDGTTAAMGNDVAVDADFGDLLDLVNFAFSANMEFNNGKWFVILDPMYADLEAPIEPGGPIGGTTEIELVILDALVGLALNEYFDVYVGARYYDQDITVVPNMLPPQPLGDSWTDYLLGVRVHNDISEKWSFIGKLDNAVGGDSDSAWYLQAMFLRHIGTNKHLDLGFRYYTVDYESGSGLTRFKWDVDHFGPVIGFSWEFGRR